MGTPIVKILVASHKEYRMPDDSIYLPLHVGAEGKVDADGQPLDLGWTKDNTGDNISRLNPGFCELTGLYWAWKNLKADYIGLVHYRRHFSASTGYLFRKNGGISSRPCIRIMPIRITRNIWMPRGK